MMTLQTKLEFGCNAKLALTLCAGLWFSACSSNGISTKVQPAIGAAGVSAIVPGTAATSGSAASGSPVAGSTEPPFVGSAAGNAASSGIAGRLGSAGSSASAGTSGVSAMLSAGASGTVSGASGTSAGASGMSAGAGGTSAGAGGTSAGASGASAGASGGHAGASGSSSAGRGGAGRGGAGRGGAGRGGAGSGGESGSSGAAGDSAGASGAAGSGTGKSPFVATGEPITGAPMTWVWVEFPKTKCRDGSPAGISVNLNPKSDKVVFYLEGGGGCYSADTCQALISPANIPVGSRNPGAGGIFNRSNQDNPVRDWNYVYAPYCTGDVFLGDNDEGQIDGVQGTQHFMGRPNLEAFFQRVVPTFANAKQVMWTGISAGGFGAAWSSEYAQWAFGSIPLTVIDDSGPPVSNKFVPQCLLDLQSKAWRLDRTTLVDCGADCTQGGDTQAETIVHFSKAVPPPTIALIETDQDLVIRGFFGVGVDGGKNDCKGALDIINPHMSADLFQTALRDYRDRVKGYPTFGTFFVENSTQHTWLRDDSFYGNAAQSHGTRMVDWVRGVLAGKPGTHLGL
jgi:hypothetical protein